MINAYDIIATIQRLPTVHRAMPFLTSLASSAFKYGSLTDRQQAAFLRILDQIATEGVQEQHKEADYAK